MNTFLKDFLIKWNLKFKYDRQWRKKYSIAFGSEQHLKMSQIDIYNDLLEDRMFKKLEKDYIKAKEEEVEYKKTGKFLKEKKMSQEDEDKLYKKIKLSL